MSLSKESVWVHSLVGGVQIDFYIQCLLSLVTQCKDQFQLALHSDGTLSQQDQDKILESFNKTNVSFTNPSESREKVLDELQGRPHCQKIRNDSIWGIEFFDPLFHDQLNNISFYIDADILFIRPFKGLFDQNLVSEGAFFLRDTQWDAYSLRPWHLLGFKQKPHIVRGITTALVFWDKTVLDWDYLEWFLGQVQYHKIPEWILPTAQAGLATRCDSKTIESSQVLNMYPNAKIQKDTFGLHLLGSYRQSWLPKVEKYKSSEKLSLNLISPRFESCVKQTPLGYGINQTKRWFNTRLNLW